MDRMSDIRFGGLRTLAIVIERGSITAAAAHMGITPSAVGKQITRLEEDVGVRLLQRSTRRVHPTAAGLSVYDRARPLLEELSDTINSISSEEAQVSGLVRISATPTFGRIHILPILAQLSREHPQLRFDLKLSEKMHDFIEDEIDIAVREGDLDDSSLYSVLIREGVVQLYASPGYLEQHGSVESLDDLSKHDLILVPKTGLSDSSSAGQGKRLPRLVPRFAINELFSVRDLALAGLGIAGLPDYMAEEYVQLGDLVLCLPEFIPMSLPIHAVYPSKRFVAKRVQVVLDKLRKSQTKL